MDSTGVQIVLDTGVTTFDILLPQIGMFVVIPLLALIKRWAVLDAVPTPLWAGILSQVAAFGLNHYMALGTEPLVTMQAGFALAGSSLIAYRMALLIKDKK